MSFLRLINLVISVLPYRSIILFGLAPLNAILSAVATHKGVTKEDVLKGL